MAKLKVQAQHLQPGDIVSSGEKVEFVVKQSIRLPSDQVEVALMKEFKRRHARWGKYTMINVERADA